jgi:hypothetical protein
MRAKMTHKKALDPDSDPDSLEMLDPDSMNPDPQHCGRPHSKKLYKDPDRYLGTGTGLV